MWRFSIALPAVDLKSEFNEVHCYLGAARVDTHTPGRPIDCLRKAVAFNPQYVEVWNELQPPDAKRSDMAITNNDLTPVSDALCFVLTCAFAQIPANIQSSNARRVVGDTPLVC